jgi:steroid 5-alpha reductase family enzyme
VQTLSASETFVTLASASVGVAIKLWPITLAILTIAVIALTVGRPLQDRAFRQRLPLLLITYALPLIVLIVGTIFRYDWTNHPTYVEPPYWYGLLLWGVVAIHGLTLIAAPILMARARLRSAAIVMPGFWLTLGAGFVAGIAIAGVGL